MPRRSHLLLIVGALLLGCVVAEPAVAQGSRAATASPLGSEPQHLTNVAGRMFFSADDGANGRELWRSDGTPAGTAMVKDIAPGAASSTPRALTPVAGVLFFTANDGVDGYELWRSDGTADGTRMVRDIKKGPAGSLPRDIVNVRGHAFLSAQDGT